MLKALALLRTLFLVALVGYTVWSMPWSFGLPAGSAEAYDACRSGLTLLTRGIWAAIAWIGFDTAIGWALAAARKPKDQGKEKKKEEILKPGEPPFAPPPR